mgnify:CR=1 FL=1
MLESIANWLILAALMNYLLIITIQNKKISVPCDSVYYNGLDLLSLSFMHMPEPNMFSIGESKREECR